MANTRKQTTLTPTEKLINDTAQVALYGLSVNVMSLGYFRRNVAEFVARGLTGDELATKARECAQAYHIKDNC